MDSSMEDSAVKSRAMKNGKRGDERATTNPGNKAPTHAYAITEFEQVEFPGTNDTMGTSRASTSSKTGGDGSLKGVRTPY
jgi:hypothetical protein